MTEPEQMPSLGSPEYVHAASVGKLERQIGQLMVTQCGVDMARENLAAAIEDNDEPK